MNRGTSLAQKILIPNLILIALLVFVLGCIYFAGRHIRTDLVQTTDSIKQQNDNLTTLNNIRRDRQKAIVSYRFERDPIHIQALSATDAVVRQLMEDLERGARSERERRLIKRISEMREVSIQGRESLLKAAREGNERDIELAYTQWAFYLQNLDALYTDYTVLTAKSLDRNIALTDKVRSRTMWIVVLAVLVAIILNIVFAALTRRQIVTPIRDMTETARAISRGDLSQRVSGAQRSDEIGSLAGNFNEMAESLSNARSQLERSIQELSRSNSDLEQFAYISSHDLKEPLRMVSLYTQMLEKDYGAEIPPKAREYIHHIVDSAKRMQCLINDLLVYSRVSSGQERLESVDLAWILETAKQDLRASIMDTHATITAGPLPSIKGSPALLLQLFENLISNALKFRGDRTPEVQVSCARFGGDWILSFRDNGIGIRQEYREKVFVIFQRLHSRKEYPGTGIGLAVCKKIVERSGGKIWVESDGETGSVFKIRLPALGAPMEAAIPSNNNKQHPAV